jgi:myo-inositol-1(or 4)-monophosphatase
LPAADLKLLVEAAEAAGRIALRHFGRRPEIWDKADGAGPVTEADLEIDRMLRAELLAARPGYGWLSEETEDGPERLEAERAFVVDPLDGTRAFIAGEASFAHSLAVVERGLVTAGVVHLPKLGRTYTAALGQGAWRDGVPIRASGRETVEGARVLAPSANFRTELWPGGMPLVARHFRPSIAYRLCLAAEGRFDAMLTLRETWEWDVAAGSLAAAEAGAIVTSAAGEAPAFNRAVPRLAGIVAAGPVLHRALMERLCPETARGERRA